MELLVLCLSTGRPRSLPETHIMNCTWFSNFGQPLFDSVLFGLTTAKRSKFCEPKENQREGKTSAHRTPPIYQENKFSNWRGKCNWFSHDGQCIHNNSSSLLLLLLLHSYVCNSVFSYFFYLIGMPFVSIIVLFGIEPVTTRVWCGAYTVQCTQYNIASSLGRTNTNI